MRKLISIITIFALSSMMFAAATQVNRAPVKMSRQYAPRVEANVNLVNSTDHSTPIVNHNNRNSFSSTVVDSSKNGYGMITSPTNPLFVGDEGLFFVYRQWAGAAGTSGQIGAAYSDDGDIWTTYYNLNGLGMEVGRYPSALGSADYPYAFWNEYTGTGNPSYGGRPFYAYDEFGWDGGSFSSPIDTDLTWFDGKDLWVGSPVISSDGSVDYFNVSYSDWTRSDCWLFHSEAVEDGYVIFGSEIKVLDENADFVGGTDEGSYTSTPILEINDDGIGYFASSAYFSGADVGASVVADGSYHTAIFRMTTDHGATWIPAQTPLMATADKYYYIPDNVVDHMFNSGLFPTTWSDPDNCPDSEDYTFTELFMTYDFDLKVDADGNPHFIMGVLPGDGEYIFPGIDYANGYYHFTIDKEYLDEPGDPQTATGWNYSFVASLLNTWGWSDAAGSSYWQIAFPSLSLGPNGNMFVVSSMVSEGSVNDPDGDPCTYDSEYPEWSNDVYVMKSEDGGASWWCPYNASDTPDPDPTDNDSPEEISAHAGSSADADGVFVNFQMPIFANGSSTGDAGDPDHNCRVYVGYVELTSSSGQQPDCNDDICGTGVIGDSNGDGQLNILDIVGMVNFILGTGTVEYECAADFNGDGQVNILDIVGMVNCILGTGPCDGGLARVVDGGAATATLIGNRLETNGFVGGIQFDGVITSEIKGNDIVESANGKTIIYNIIDGMLETTSFIFDTTPENMVVASSVGENVDITIASEYAVLSSYPNPFNPQTTISYEINVNNFVELGIYNMLGQQVASLVNGFVEVGDYHAVWNSTDSYGNEVASGIYIVKLTTGNQVISNKITLLR